MLAEQCNSDLQKRNFNEFFGDRYG